MGIGLRDADKQSGDSIVSHSNKKERRRAISKGERGRGGKGKEANRCLGCVVLIRGGGELRGMTISGLGGRRGGESGGMRRDMRGIRILCVLHVDLLAGWSKGQEWLLVCLFVRNATFRIRLSDPIFDHEKEKEKDGDERGPVQRGNQEEEVQEPS